jgi:catechol 2,3-dioxygenase-like lactoylglutathione lyase family enzyme
VRIEALDHVALWVTDRDRLAGFLLATLDVHVVDRSDAFTLVGADGRRGKLTLFAADGPREAGALDGVGFRVASLEQALARLPDGIPAEVADGTASLTAPEGLRIRLVEAPTDLDYDLDHVSLLVPDPRAARDRLATLGFDATDGELRAGAASVRLVAGAPAETDRPLLNHLGLLVESAEHHLEEARERGLEVADVVDAANTYAVFVWGPERIKLEYVEHKPTFSLT